MDFRLSRMVMRKLIVSMAEAQDLVRVYRCRLRALLGSISETP